MLFNSYTFLFLFLPIALGGFYLISNFRARKVAIGWLIFASIVFYSYWDPRYTLLLLISAAFNFIASRLLLYLSRQDNKKFLFKITFVMSIIINLLVLGYFKYANFFAESLNKFQLINWKIRDIILPLGISFFTFTQLSYLIDIYKGNRKTYSLLNYLLFVTYFPHLIAGPIIRHRDIIPQFQKKETSKIIPKNLLVGFTIFVMGLSKKIILADLIAGFANPIFNLAASSPKIGLFESWYGAIFYSLQLYFDFSAYSNMAVGLSLMFNIKLPINFNSPYKSMNIKEFWGRWHITLSNYLRDYLYIPLGGNRLGRFRKYLNLLITMLIGGLWHGAGWTFMFWGLLHGVYLVINHAWIDFVKPFLSFSNSSFISVVSRATTWTSVVIAWVFFRSPDLPTAFNMVRGMLGFNNTSLPTSFSEIMPLTHLNGLYGTTVLFISLLIVFFLPNPYQITAKFNPALGISEYIQPSKFNWKASVGWSLIMGILLGISILNLGQASEFLYYQF